jgi:hypothetical protein
MASAPTSRYCRYAARSCCAMSRGRCSHQGVRRDTHLTILAECDPWKGRRNVQIQTSPEKLWEAKRRNCQQIHVFDLICDTRVGPAQNSPRWGQQSTELPAKSPVFSHPALTRMTVQNSPLFSMLLPSGAANSRFLYFPLVKDHVCR